MADIDMIPRSYRDRVRVRALLRISGAALMLVVLAGAIAGGVLRWQSAGIERTLARREAAIANAQGEAARGAALQQQRQRLEQADVALRALRRDGELAGLVQALDTALPENVWLTALQVERDVQQLAPAMPAAGTDLVIAVPVSPAAPSGSQAWRLASTVRLAGQAASLADVSAFLARFERQPGIARLVLAGSSLDAATGLVTFRAAADLVTEARP